MRLTTLAIAATLVSTAALAQTTTAPGPNTGTTMPAGPNTSAPPIAGGNTPNAVAGPNNSTGNMDRTGAGPGTTGTGSKGGSGNE